VSVSALARKRRAEFLANRCPPSRRRAKVRERSSEMQPRCIRPTNERLRYSVTSIAERERERERERSASGRAASGCGSAETWKAGRRPAECRIPSNWRFNKRFSASTAKADARVLSATRSSASPKNPQGARLVACSIFSPRARTRASHARLVVTIKERQGSRGGGGSSTSLSP